MFLLRSAPFRQVVDRGIVRNQCRFAVICSGPGVCEAPASIVRCAIPPETLRDRLIGEWLSTVYSLPELPALRIPPYSADRRKPGVPVPRIAQMVISDPAHLTPASSALPKTFAREGRMRCAPESKPGRAAKADRQIAPEKRADRSGEAALYRSRRSGFRN